MIEAAYLTSKSYNFLNNRRPQRIQRNSIFRIGMGIDEGGIPPMRTLVYLMSIFAIKNEPAFREQRFQLYFPDLACMRLGAKQENVAAFCQQVTRWINYMEETIAHDGSPKLEILYEKDPTDERRQFVQSKCRLLQDFIEQNPSAAVSTFLVQKGRKSGLETSITYAVEHALFMGDPVSDDQNLFLIEHPVDNSEIIMIGGQSEKVFHKARQLILSLSKIDEKNEQLFLHGGIPPVYYRQAGEPSISGQTSLTADLLENLDDRIRADYCFMVLFVSLICKDLPSEYLSKKQIRNKIIHDEEIGPTAIARFNAWYRAGVDCT